MAPSDEDTSSALLRRIDSALEAIIALDPSRKSAWLNSYNTGLAWIPEELIKTIDGQELVAGYLESQIVRS